MIGWLAPVSVDFPHVLVEYVRHGLEDKELQSVLSNTTNKPSFSSKVISHSSRCFTDRQQHSNDVRAYLWRRLIYRDADRTALCFQNGLGSYSNLP